MLLEANPIIRWTKRSRAPWIELQPETKRRSLFHGTTRRSRSIVPLFQYASEPNEEHAHS
eukprot:579133-Pleurochrysis_carterae.AAC.1